MVDYVEQQVRVEPGLFGKYVFSGRTIERHCAEIRRELGLRECVLADEGAVAAWMAFEVCPVELTDDRQRRALLARCRAQQVEPLGPSWVDRVLGAARAACEQQFTGAGGAVGGATRIPQSQEGFLGAGDRGHRLGPPCPSQLCRREYLPHPVCGHPRWFEPLPGRRFERA